MTKDMKYSPAVEFLSAQHRHRAAVRDAFKKEAGDFLLAHEFVLSGITSCLERFGDKKWPADLDEAIRLKAEQTSQLSALFLHGIDPCEVAISEGLYCQAATLVRQQMEILGAIDEVWLNKRTPHKTPNVGSLPKAVRQHYGGLTDLAHAGVPDYLKSMHTDIKGDLVGAAIVPTFNKDMALFLYRIELHLLFLFVTRQKDALEAAYEEEAFIASEHKLFAAAMSAVNKAAEEIGDLPNADPA